MPKSSREPKLGQHSWSGVIDPNNMRLQRYRTFSVGVFKWEAKSNGRGLKRGPVVVRVSGDVELAQSVYETAEQAAIALDAGTYTGKSRVKVTV